VTLAVLVAVAAACCFALGNAIQHRAAGSVARSGGVAAMMWRLLRSPQWLVGSAIAFTAFLLHVTAMNLGVVAVVQPILLTAVLLAVPVRALLDRELPARSELVWVGVTVLAIAVFVSTANPDRDAGTPHDSRALLVTLLGFGAGLLWAATMRWYSLPAARAFVLATGSGVLFGIAAGLMKFVRHDAEGGWTGVVESWHLWALLFGSIIGTTVNQRSYQQAKISASLPAMNVTNVATAVAFAWFVFDEPPALTVSGFVVQALCLLVTAVGLLQIARVEDRLEAAAQHGEPDAAHELDALS
jgi:hypothetical protein